MTTYDGILFAIPGCDVYLGYEQSHKLYGDMAIWAKSAKPGDYYVLKFEDECLRAYTHLDAPTFPIPPLTRRDEPLVIMFGIPPGKNRGHYYAITLNEFIRVFNHVISMQLTRNSVRWFGYTESGDLMASRTFANVGEHD